MCTRQGQAARQGWGWQILPASVLHWTRNWPNGAHWLVGFFFLSRRKKFVRSLHGVKTEVVRTLLAIYGHVLVCVRMLLSNRLTPFVRLSYRSRHESEAPSAIKRLYNKQECCIPVGCGPPASVAVSGGGGICPGVGWWIPLDRHPP